MRSSEGRPWRSLESGSGEAGESLLASLCSPLPTLNLRVLPPLPYPHKEVCTVSSTTEKAPRLGRLSSAIPGGADADLPPTTTLFRISAVSRASLQLISVRPAGPTRAPATVPRFLNCDTCFDLICTTTTKHGEDVGTAKYVCAKRVETTVAREVRVASLASLVADVRWDVLRVVSSSMGSRG